MSEDGYVFLRGRLDRAKVDQVLDDFVRILKAHGYVVPGSSSSPVWSGKELAANDFSPLPPRGAVTRALAGLQSTRELYNSREMLDVLRALFGGEAYPMDENDDRLRAVPPTSREVLGRYLDNPAGTPFISHQDHETLRYPDGSVYPFHIAWTPMMEITKDVGGLAIVRGSHKSGYYEHFTLKGEDMGAPVDRAELRRWREAGAVPSSGDSEPSGGKKSVLRSDTSPGDVIIFHPLTLHRGLPNSSKLFRISADFRYAKKSAPKIWRADKNIEYIYAWFRDVIAAVKETGFDPDLAARINNRLFVEGPASAKSKSLKRRIEEARRELEA